MNEDGSQEPRAKSQEQRTKNKEQRTKSQEQGIKKKADSCVDVWGGLRNME